MLDPLPPAVPPTARDKLLTLLDYVADVVRLDERVAFTLDDYRLADGRTVRIGPADTGGLPGVTHDGADEDGPVWLAVERIARSEPPAPPPELAAWLGVSADPARAPAVIAARVERIDEAERLARVANGAPLAAFFAIEGEAVDGAAAPPSYEYRQTLDAQPELAVRLDGWIAESWAAWAAMEGPRRRTIALYERLYALIQQVEGGGSEASVEVVWGIGMVRWRAAGRRIERPLLERGVDLDLDPADGVIRIRPTVADVVVDLKPYDELGLATAPLEGLIRREGDRTTAPEGVSPFRPDSYGPILAAAAVRLQPDGVYQPGEPAAAPATDGPLTIDDAWVMFARPRATHVLLADIDRLREAAGAEDRPVEGVALRLVTEPSTEPADWAPLSDALGATEAPPAEDDAAASPVGDVFFPKPFNDDQIAIVHRLDRGDGLVVQGPPGTGKTHTIANLICHCMATGKRVLVVSRGEAALAVLRDQLPEKVRPLAIALLSNEREGLSQVEAAIRAVHGAVDGSRPEIRLAAIRRCEAEIVKSRARIAALDDDLDALAAAEHARMGPRGETPAEFARRFVAEREQHAWFVDEPERFAADSGLDDDTIGELAAARRLCGDLLDHLEAVLPAPADLPEPATVGAWHGAIRHAADLTGRATAGPVRGLALAAADRAPALALADALDGIAAATDALGGAAWLAALLGGPGAEAWTTVLTALCHDRAEAVDARAAAVDAAVELPPGFLDDAEGREAVARGARGEAPWPMLALGRGAAKARLAAVRVRGAPVRDGDAEAWRAVQRALDMAVLDRGVEARWRAFAREAAAPAAGADLLDPLAVLLRHREAAARIVSTQRGLRAALPALRTMTDHPARARATAEQLRAAAEATRLASGRVEAGRVRALFADGADRTSAMARRLLDEAVGREAVDTAWVEAAWAGLLRHLGKLHERAGAFATISAATERIGAAGAPAWAARLRREPIPAEGGDPLMPPGWRDAWDAAAAGRALTRRNARERLAALSAERGELDRQVRRLFVELVRERTYYALERRLSPNVKAALVEFVRALARLGKGTGRTAGRQRRVARDAMRRCYDAVPCWIMPTWRVAEQLPPVFAAFDLVILDEASQSDVTELPAVLRGRKLLVVGDDRQVSPAAPFVGQGKIEALRRRHLAGLPFASLLEPGESLYTLMQAVFPDERLMLKEHFRCVEPIIRFSMGFYPEPLMPLRVPAAHERLDPPLVDILVPHGRRLPHRKVNPDEALLIVDAVAEIAATPGLESRSIGVISLIGGEQAAHIRALLAERLGAAPMQRHRVLCGDSAAFQGNERDIVFLSMVADRTRRTALTMLRYAQRFNVAMSRGRDRVVLVRSVEAADLNPADLKARLIAHFADPMPAAPPGGEDPLERCESPFERAVLGRLLTAGYRATPQVGAVGYRIDIVVEGEGGRRLAVECDGDRFHGPEQWRADMARQRVLERVGWRFWRCFASSFYADPDAVMADLVATLDRAGIAPRLPGEAGPAGPSPWVEHRVAAAPPGTPAPATEEDAPPGARAAAVGDRLVLTFADERRPVTVTLTEAVDDDWGSGRLAATSPLGQALLGAEEDEEVDLPFPTGGRRAVVERIVRARGTEGTPESHPAPATPANTPPLPTTSP